MAAKSYYLDDALLNAVLCNTSYSSPATVYAGLFTVTPTGPGDAGTEVSGGSYARVAVTFSASPTHQPGGSQTSNTAPVNFPAATAGWGTVMGVGIFDNLAGGNLLYYGDLGTSKLVNNGDSVSFAATALAVTES